MNANTQCFIPGQIINNRAARSFRYTVLPVGSRSRLRSYSGARTGGDCLTILDNGYGWREEGGARCSTRHLQLPFKCHGTMKWKQN